MRRVLMIAFHFPPLAGSSGIQRTLRFAQYLPDHGWQPVVLTASPRAYERTSDDLLREVPPASIVHRAAALNTAKHLAVGGRYPTLLARPDRWVTWAFAAIPAGLRLIDPTLSTGGDLEQQPDCDGAPDRRLVGPVEWYPMDRRFSQPDGAGRVTACARCPMKFGIGQTVTTMDPANGELLVIHSDGVAYRYSVGSNAWSMLNLTGAPGLGTVGAGNDIVAIPIAAHGVVTFLFGGILAVWLYRHT